MFRRTVLVSIGGVWDVVDWGAVKRSVQKDGDWFDEGTLPRVWVPRFEPVLWNEFWDETTSVVLVKQLWQKG